MQDMASLSLFDSLVSPEVPGAIKPVIQSKVAQALSRYLRETTAWRECSQVQLLPNFDAEIPLPYEDVTIGGILRAVVGEEEIPAGDLTRISPVHARYPVSEKTPLTIDIFLVNTAQITEMPKSLFDLHGDVVAAGAKSILMMMPGTQWFNPQLAAFYKDEFDSELLRISHDVHNGFNASDVARTKKPISFYI